MATRRVEGPRPAHLHPGPTKEETPRPHNRRLYKKRCRIKNAFAPLKDWRGSATRYTRRGDLFVSTICLAATVLSWLQR